MKYFDQEHIERMIQTLSEDQFRRFVKEYLRLYYKTQDVEIIDGPNDGGNDAKIYINGNHYKISIQITVQENINKKIIEDIVKAKYNSDNHGYMPNLWFFYSKTISGVKKDEFSQEAELKYSINLRIFDKKSLASAIDIYPKLYELLSTLALQERNIIPTRINSKNKILFDVLTSGGEINDVKTQFILALTQYFIFENGAKNIKDIISYINSQLNCSIDKSYFLELISSKVSGIKILDRDMCSLEKNKQEQIISIKTETEQTQNEIIRKIEDICKKFEIVNINPEQIFRTLVNTYKNIADSESNNVLMGKEWLNDKNELITPLVKLIATNNREIDINNIVTQILKIAATEPYFAKLSTTRLFTNLFKKNELDEYLASIPKNIYLDTQILLQIICCLFEDCDYQDFQYQSVKSMLKHIQKSICQIYIYTSLDYVEEVCAHLWDAYAVAEIEEHLDFNEFGKSNNIFYKFYLFLIDSNIKKYHHFCEFIEDLIGLDIYSYSNRNEFIKEATPSISTILAFQDMHEIKIIDTGFIEQFLLEKLSKEYNIVETIGHPKPYRAMISDIKMVQFLSNPKEHINPHTQLPNEPYLITWDFSLYKYRHHILGKNTNSLFWYIYTPLKFANRLSVMNFKPDSTAITYDLINVAEYNYNISSTKRSFIDTLSMFVGNSKENSWAIAKRIKRLYETNKDASKNVDFSHIKTTEYIETILIKMASHYSKPTSDFSMPQLIQLIQDDNYADKFDRFINSAIRSFENNNVVDFGGLDSLLKQKFRV